MDPLQALSLSSRDRSIATVGPPDPSSSPLFQPPRICAFLGCDENRVSSRGYCAVHHSLFIAGKTPVEASVNDIENSLYRLKDTIRRSYPSATFTDGPNPAFVSLATSAAIDSRQSSVSTSSTVPPPYLQSIHQYISKTLEYLRKPESSLPSQWDIFNFQGITYNDNITSPVHVGVPDNGAAPSDDGRSDDSLSPNPLIEHNSAPAAGAIPPIVEIQLVQSKKRETLPIGFSLLERSMGGKEAADLNRTSNGQRVYLVQRREGSRTGRIDKAGRVFLDDTTARAFKPITSISVIFKDAYEEPHYNFDLIERLFDKPEEASLSGGSAASEKNSRQPYLSIHRGDGAPITHIGLMLKDKRDPLPPGWHEVRHTPFGNRADLNYFSNSLQVDSNAAYLCFRVDVTPVMKKFQLALKQVHQAGGDSLSSSDLRIHSYYSRMLAVIASLFYSNDQKLILHALECFRSLPSEGIHPILLNTFIHTLCDATPLFLVYFTTQTHASLLKFLLAFTRFYFPALSISSMLKIGEVCFLIRHEDKQFEISEQILRLLCSEIDRVRPCECTVKAALDALRQEGKEETPKISPLAASSYLCHRCQRTRYENSLPIREWTRSLMLQLASNVSTAKQLESDVKSFQRHKRTSEEFRYDSAKTVNKLFGIDAEFAAIHGKQKHRSSFSVDSSSDKAPGSSRPAASGSRQLNSAGLILHSHSVSNPNSNRLASIADDSNDSPPPERAFSAPGDSHDSQPPSPYSIADLAPLDSSVYLMHHKFDDSSLPDGERISFNQKHERFLFSFTLLCCKFATESVNFNVKKSETVKRKSHGLRLLLFILQNSGGFFKSSPAGIHLLRRFVCPALIDSCITDSLAIFRLILQIFTVLWENFKDDLLIELGAFLDHIFLTFLESAYTSDEQKKDILEVLMHILRSPMSLIDLFYNYDNHSKCWDIFDRLQCILSKIAEGDLAKAAASAQQKVENFNTVINNEQSDVDASNDVSSTEILQKAALKLLVHFLHLMCQWLGTPGCKRAPGIPAKPLISERQESADEPEIETMPMNELQEMKSREKSGTWSARYDHQKIQQKIFQHAVKLARQEKLSAALQYLKIVNPSNALPREIARFLYHTDGLNKAEVGDFLSNGEDKLMSAEEYENLRTEYLKLLDFTGMSFDASMRLYLCDSGFRLPGESQKIDRLLESFCKAYCRDNPQVFKNTSAALVMAFAIVMLNTDVHDPRLKSGNSSRKPMTLEQFLSNLRGLNDGKDFPRSFLENAYNSICANPIEWRDDREKSAEQRSADMEAARLDDQRQAARKSFEVAVRKALAFLKNHAADEQSFQHTNNTLIVQGMFELSWYRAIAAISTRSDNAGTDIDLLHLCLEGLAYGSTIAVVLGLPTERQAFTRQLAKITFIERNRDSKSMDIGRRIAHGDHLKQEWYKPLNLTAEKNPVRACLIIFGIVTEFKAKINFERRQATLKRIESDFGGEICLVDPNRQLIREGKLIKVGEKNQKRVSYHFMLFNDLILYASEGINTKYKCHRVIHLSLCRLEDLTSFILPHSWRIVSPQKSFIVSAPSKEKKSQWMEAILANIKIIAAKRKKFFANQVGSLSAGVGVTGSPTSQSDSRASASFNDGPLMSPSHSQKDRDDREKVSQKDKDKDSLSVSGSANSTSSMSVPAPSPINGLGADQESILRRYSTFIGQSELDLSTPAQSPTSAGSSSSSGLRSLNHCKLCIRPFAIFRRRQKCRFCSDIVCSDCCTRKVTIPGEEKRLQLVCDACYGALKGMIGENVPVMTTVETSNSGASTP